MTTRRRAHPARFQGLVEPMEPRLLFNADVLATMAVVPNPPPEMAEEVRLQPAVLASSQQQAPRELVFVDADVANADRLIDDILSQDGGAARFEVHRLQAGDDGIVQITQVLADRRDVAAIHLISHGADGQIKLGDTVLSAGNLAEHSASLSAWSTALQPHADILIYGCDLAASTSGQAFIQDLSLLTGADVAASIDATGSASMGGDWVLEFNAGHIDTDVAPGAVAQQRWQGLLALTGSGGETRVNTNATNTQTTNTQRQVGMDASGNHVVVWHDGGNVWAKVLSASGATVVADFTVGAGSEAQVAMNASGQFVVAWNDGSGVTAQRYNANGSTSGAAITVSSQSLAKAPAIAMNDSGNFAVTWSENYTDFSFNAYRDGYVAVYSWAGTVLAPTVFSSGANNNYTDNSDTAMSTSVSMNSAGKFVVVTERGRAIINQSDIWLWTFNANGTSGGISKQQVNTANVNACFDPSVGLDDSDNIAITWTANNDVYTRRATFSSGVTGSEARVNATATNNQTVSSVGMNTVTGRYVVVYQDSVNSNDVFVREYDAAGTAVATEARVNTTTANGQNAPSAAYNGNHIVVVWSGNGTQSGQSDGAGVFEQRYSMTNAAPVNTVPAALQFAQENTAKVFSTANGNRIAIADADAGSSQVEVTLAATSGTVTLAGTSGLTFSTGDGSGDATMTFRGTVSAINTALDGLSYTGAASFYGMATLGITTSDLGNTGSGGTMTDSDTVNLLVSPVNNASINNTPAAQALNEDGALVFSSANGNLISVTDTDAASIQLTLSATQGSLTLSQTTGLSFTAGDGTADTTMTFTGAVADVNAALAGLSYTPTANYNGPDTITISSQDRTLTTLNVDTSLQGRYAFENTGAMGSDSSPAGGYNGTATNLTAVSDATRGNVASYSGNGNLQINNRMGSPTNVTVAAWINVNTADSWGTSVITIGDTINLVIDESFIGDKFAGYFHNGSAYYKTTFDITLAGTGWHHVAYTVDSTNNLQALYLDGVAVATTTHTQNVSYNQETITRIGKFARGGFDGGHDLNGRLDEARIYSRAVSASEIAALASDLPAPNTDTDNIGATVSAVNDAPTLTGTSNFNTITEDQTSNTGQLVSSLLSTSDIDSGALSGVAIHTLASGNGTWQYSTDGGGNWSNVGAVSSASALQLRSTDRVRFVPDGANADSGSISFYAWDQATGTAGTKADASTRGGTTAFSSGSGTSSITVTAVNDAPGVTGSSDFNTITEDQTGNTGQLVSSLFTRTDVDSGAASGMVIHTVSSGAGSWQYSLDGGNNWSAIAPVSSASALALRSTDRVRFVPDALNADMASIGYYAWDQSSGSAGSKLDASTRGGSTAFSSNSGSSSITVTAINDAPALSGANNLTAINEDETGSTGTLITALLAGQLTDADTGAASGIAVTAVDNSNGTWQYTTNGGSNWTAFGSPSAGAARLLAANGSTAIRFVPNGNWHGTAAITFRAWDQSTGTAGTTADTSSTGGTTAFSTASASPTITVNPVNDAPVLTGTNNFTAINEDSGGGTGTLISSLTTGQISDIDSGAVDGIAVTAVDNSNGTWQYTTNGGGNWTAFGAVAEGSARLLASNANTAIRFVPNSDWHGTAAITYRAWDQSTGVAGGTADASASGGTTAFSAASASPTITVNPVNDAPTASATPLNPNYTESAGAGTIAAPVALFSGSSAGTGEAGQALTSLTLTITGLVDGSHEKLLADGSTLSLGANASGTTVTNGMGYTITVGGGTATVTLVKAGGITSAAAQALIDALAYQNTNADNPAAGARTVTLTQIKDNGGTASGGADTTALSIASTVTVVPANDLPQANDDTASTNLATPVDIDVKSNDSDPDHSTASLTIQIVSSSAGTNATVNPDGTIEFDPGAETGALTVVYRLQDPLGALSNDATVTVTVAPNTPPTGADNATTFDEDTAYTMQSADFGFADADLGQSFGGVRIEALPTFGQLTLNGAAVAANQVISEADIAAGRLVFTPGTNDNGSTTLSFKVRDNLGQLATLANTFTFQVSAVNDAPANAIPADQSTDEDAPITFSTGGGNAITVSDVDAAAGTLRITLSVAQGTLSLSGTAGLGFITGDGSADATMVFTGTVADVNAALEGMQYTSTAHYNGTDTLNLLTQDQGNTGSGGNLSQASSVDITVQAVNDAPVLTSANDFTAIAEDDTGNAGQLVSSLLNSGDADTGALNGVALNSLSSGRGTWQYSTNGGTNWTQVGAVSHTSALLLRGTDRLRFVPDGLNADTASVSFHAWDQTSGTVATKVNVGTRGDATALSTAGATSAITITGVNDAPVLTGINDMTGINEDDTASAGTLVSTLVAGLTSDVDGGALAGIAVTSVDNSHGSWQYTLDGSNWIAFGSPAEASARLLAADATTAIRFVPGADWHGTASIALRAWDQSTGTAGNTADASTHGGTTAFSSAAASPSITVSALNDAPVLAGIQDFAAIAEDAAAGAGTLVADLIAGQISDSDTGALTGIAVTSVDNTNGTWQYTLDGSNWLNFGAPSDAAARLLAADASTAIRFLPDANWHGTSAITMRAWDRSTGSAGNTADATTQGGTTAFSTATAAPTLVVSAVNDAPALTGVNDFPVINEDTTGGSGTLVADLIAGQITDVDSGALMGIAVTGVDNTHGTWQYTLDGSAWLDFGAAADASARLLSANATTAIRFAPDPEWHGTASITVRAWDQSTGAAGGTADASAPGGASAFSAATADASVTVVSVNDAPVLSGGNAFTAISEDQPTSTGTRVSDLIAGHVTDMDTGALAGIAITAVDNTHGVWQYTTDGGGTWIAFGSPSVSAARLLGSDADTLIRFVPDTNWNGSANVTFRAWDRSTGTAGGIADSASHGGSTAFSASTAISGIQVQAVNDAPVLSGINGFDAIDEDSNGGNGTSITALLAGRVSDVDSGAQAGIAVTGVDNMNGAWQYTIDGGTTWMAFGLVTEGSARLLAADASTAMRFVSTSDWHGTASVTLRAWDRSSGLTGSTADTTINGGASAFSSATATPSITIAAVNDAPVINRPSAQNTQPGEAVAFGAAQGNAITLHDVDAASDTAQLSLSTAHGLLNLGSNAGITLVTGIGVNDRAMVLQGSMANLNNALSGLRYTPDAGFVGTDSLTIALSDLGASGAGGAQQTSGTIDIRVTGQPLPWTPPTDGGSQTPSGTAPSGGSPTSPEQGANDAPPSVSSPPATRPPNGSAQLDDMSQPPITVSGNRPAGAAYRVSVQPPGYWENDWKLGNGLFQTTEALADLLRTRIGGVQNGMPLIIAPPRPSAEGGILPYVGRNGDLADSWRSADQHLAASYAAYGTGLGITIGTLWWSSRIGGLLTSIILSTPAWRVIDPLPILNRPDDEDEDTPPSSGPLNRDHHEVEQMFDVQPKHDEVHDIA